MNKKTKISIIIAVSVALFLYWAALALTHTKYRMIDYLWQAALSVAVILFGVFGMLTAKRWSWLKSGVGQGIFFIALGMFMWGLGQAGWTYFVIKDPSQQTPPTHILDVIYFSSIPLWAYGMFKLSKATGARYGLRKAWAKAAVVVLILLIFALSYYFLVDVARGGTSYFHQPFLEIVFDLGYAAGDAINLTLALAIFGLSWKFLGGMFKRPILLILFGFAVVYFADFLFSFYDGKGQYYNGHWVDLLYLAMAAIFGIGLCMLDPPKRVPAAVPVASPEPVAVPPSAQQAVFPTEPVAAVPAPDVIPSAVTPPAPVAQVTSPVAPLSAEAAQPVVPPDSQSMTSPSSMPQTPTPAAPAPQTIAATPENNNPESSAPAPQDGANV